MSRNVYQVNQEVEINLNVKVKLESFNDYRKLSKEEILDEIADAKGELKDFIRGELRKEYYNETLTCGVDGWNFEVI